MKIYRMLVAGFVLLAASATNAAPALLHITVASVGLSGPLVTGNKDNSYYYYLVSVTDDHGLGVTGLKPINFSVFPVFISAATRTPEILHFKVEGVFGASTAAQGCMGCYLLQVSSSDPFSSTATATSSCDIAAPAIIRVRQGTLIFRGPPPSDPNAGVTAAGQVAINDVSCHK